MKQQVACAQQQRVRTEQQQVTKQESLTICKDLIHDTFSCVSYLRGLFPEEAFARHSIQDIDARRLRRGVSQAVDALLDWIEIGCFDALENGYLKSIVLGIYLDLDKPEELVECYTFDVSYNQDGNAMLKLSTVTGGQVNAADRSRINEFSNDPGKTTKNEIAKNLKQTMRSILMLTQTLDPLPDGRYLTMKLLYWDDITPVDYQPPFFREATGHESVAKVADYGGGVQKWRLGGVETAHHKINIKMTTAITAADDQESEQAQEVESGNQETDMVIDNPQDQSEDGVDQSDKAEVVHEESVTVQDAPSISTLDEAKVVRCGCGDDTAEEIMVKCLQCGSYQHYLCAGFAYESDVAGLNDYRCLQCILEQYNSPIPVQPSDAQSNEQEGQVDWAMVTDVCRYRRMLGVLWRDGYSTLIALQGQMNQNYNVVKRIRNILVNDGFLKLVRGKGRDRYELIKNSNTMETKATVYSNSVLMDKLGISLDVEEAQQSVNDVEVKAHKNRDSGFVDVLVEASPPPPIAQSDLKSETIVVQNDDADDNPDLLGSAYNEDEYDFGYGDQAVEPTQPITTITSTSKKSSSSSSKKRRPKRPSVSKSTLAV
ncbi:hypothetical protein MIR68_000268 [Amoeboaphelidium protococcarum]|nr:hypothetical protein MIR68_000268 [Amoeboaphelidium protococcarum]